MLLFIACSDTIHLSKTLRFKINHLLLLHLVDHHAAQLLLGVVVAQLLLVQRRAGEQIILIRSLA